MTELEQHLLNALEQLQRDYMQRLNDWESAFAELQKMYTLTRQENARLSGQVVQLSQHVAKLSGHVKQLSGRTETLSSLYSTKN